MELERLVPPGSTGKAAKSGGTCVVCGTEEIPRSQLVVRALYEDYEADEPRTAGYKVCVRCSPYVIDLIVERYVYGSPDDDWPWRWRMNLDPGVFACNGQTVSAGW